MPNPLKLAVFGDPVEHSLSPVIHNLFAEQFGLKVDYSKIRSNIDQLPDRIGKFAAEGGIGANLTLPLKHAGLRLCRSLDRAARQARAVNTLKLEDSGWHGFNTDGAGLLLDLERIGVNTRGARILIVGAGGVTSGILGPLLGAEPALVTLLNRTLERGVELAERFEHLGPIDAGSLDQGPPREDYNLLIQATSLGHSAQSPAIDPAWLAPDAIASDLNYGQAHQPFKSWCDQHTIPCHDGLGMLIGQAALAFEVWTGQRPDVTAAIARLEDLRCLRAQGSEVRGR
jgi:shikimate dehydrogenase